ncbi:MAG: hypothetical protein IPO08_23540 [Xanthomonadales bacterium]|nr:hypothetical protein [Xanthomonadales bacterium]
MAVAATLISWGNGWIDGYNERLKLQLTSGLITDVAQRDAMLSKSMEIDAISKKQSGLDVIANVVKWVAFAALGFFAYQAFTKSRGQNGN